MPGADKSCGLSTKVLLLLLFMQSWTEVLPSLTVMMLKSCKEKLGLGLIRDRADEQLPPDILPASTVIVKGDDVKGIVKDKHLLVLLETQPVSGAELLNTGWALEKLGTGMLSA